MKNQLNLFTILLIIILSCPTKLIAQDRVVEVTTNRNTNNSIDFKYTKSRPGSYTIKINFNSLKNTNPSNEYETVIRGSSGMLLTLRPTNKEQGIGYGYKTSYTFGNSKPKVDHSFQYLLPFKIGEKITIYESNYLSEQYFGAEKPESWKFYSTNSKTVDSVYAMRKGIVVDIKNEFQNDTLLKKAYTSNTNSILIEHEDGTYAIYKGFKRNSFKVTLGDIVYPQTILGTLDKFNNESYILHFSIYYFDKDLMFTISNSTMKKPQTPYIYITPLFFTKEGLIKIVPQSSFTADSNETILTREMSKKEIRMR
jgi:murein DD-endopeptidase MepM/ murein hydrolase activator NlpD